uniref:ERCC4 domain-containing protein n=1 Tax=Malurus cyaneus samueli TaxID=2593467 RepID=A0A8C5TNG0_9PASS
MRGVYLSSVRSPALGTRYRMVHRDFNPAVIFSQIPEQDPAYAEDSFCVGDEEEEALSDHSEEEVAVNFALLTHESPNNARRPYLTRHRTRLHRAGLRGKHKAHKAHKASRIIVPSDSSDEEAAQGQERIPDSEGTGAGQSHGARQDSEGLLDTGAAGSGSCVCTPQPSSVPSRLWLQDSDLEAPAEVSAQGKHAGKSSPHPCAHPQFPHPTKQPPSLCPFPFPHPTEQPTVPSHPIPSLHPEHTPSLCVLADNRELCSGSGVISCLRAAHGLRVQLCSLGTGDYMVSARLAVDRLLQSELLSPGNRNKLSQRLQRLQSSCQRICVIVESDRARPGETSRLFQRTQHYDGVLSALVQAGIRILFSSCQEETAALLKELALLEHRKGNALRVPTEPEGHRRELLNLYLSIPNLSHAAALHLCHSFSSVAAVANR